MSVRSRSEFQQVEGDVCVRVHYLGHASFVLGFGPTVVLTDFGEPNAWASSGWDSPIHDVGDLTPDLATYSHTHHADHFAEGRLPRGPGRVSADGTRVRVGEVTAEGIPVCERDPLAPDGHAYLFSYRGLRVLHLGDCQADLAEISNPAHRAGLVSRLPSGCDLLLLPIESTTRFSAQAVELLGLLRPRVAVPMHFWSDGSLREFLERARAFGHGLHVGETPGSALTVSAGPPAAETFVVPLRRSPFTDLPSSPPGGVQ